MSQQKAIRPWCAVAQYPGLKEFLAGTIVMPREAQFHEVEAALRAHFDQFIPPGYKIIKHAAGALFFDGDTTS